MALQERYEARVGRALDLPVGIILGDEGHAKEDYLSRLLGAFCVLDSDPNKYREILLEIGNEEVLSRMGNFGSNWTKFTLMQFLEQPEVSAALIHQLIWHESDNEDEVTPQMCNFLFELSQAH